jgi:quercetin dioxygenase-like cupin family protein
MTARGKVVVLGPGRGREFRIGADRIWTKGEPSERSESFSVIEYEGAAGVPGPPPHLHRTFEEAWYILEGQVTFREENQTVTATPGTYLLVPRGVPHSFQVDGPHPARWLGIFSPGRYVGLVEELAGLMPAHGPPDPAALRRLFSKYDTELVALQP